MGCVVYWWVFGVCAINRSVCVCGCLACRKRGVLGKAARLLSSGQLLNKADNWVSACVCMGEVLRASAVGGVLITRCTMCVSVWRAGEGDHNAVQQAGGGVSGRVLVHHILVGSCMCVYVYVWMRVCSCVWEGMGGRGCDRTKIRGRDGGLCAHHCET